MKRKLCTAAVCIGMLLALALPAWAAEYGEANITPQTTMNELRENPSIVGSGLYTYSREQDCTLKQAYWGTQELEKFSNQWTAQDAAEGLNQLIRNYNAGIQITYPLYTEEEIAQDTSRDVVELYYFPAQGETKNRKYALVLGGNALITSAEIREGISTAWQMNQMGYTTFVLRYRIGIRAGGNAPMEDVARAVQYITAHAEQFDVQPEQYAVIGYSSGGQITGLFGTDAVGYRNYGLPKPGALLLGYPVNTFRELKPGYRILLDPDVLAQRYYDMNVSDYITPDYPPTFFWCGKNDLIAKHPMDGVRFTKPVRATDDIKFLTRDEQRVFLETAKRSRNYNQYALILETGLRTGEMIGLTWDAIDFQNRTLTVNKTLEYRHKQHFWRAGPPKTQQSYRTIPLTDRAYEILKGIKDKRPWQKESPLLSQTLEYIDRRTGAISRLVMRDLVFINWRTGEPAKNSSYDTLQTVR